MSSPKATPNFRTRRVVMAAALVVSVVVLAPPQEASAQGEFVFSGGGWGHRVGMSQYGALGLAEAGRGYHDILRFYYTGVSVEQRAMPGHVRVGVLWDRTDPIEVRGTKPMDFVAGSERRTVPANEQWSVHATADGRFRLLDGGGNEAAIIGGTGQPLLLPFAEADSILTLPDSGHRYRHGHAEFNVYSDGRGGFLLRVIIVVPGMETYLYGIAEVPSSWHREAQKAQATAARTYALDRIERLGQNRTPCNCALFASTLDQVYAGYDKESSSAAWVAAVNESAGHVILHGGRPISAFYSSSNGGSSEGNEHGFGGTPLPYLRPVFDPWSNHPSNPHRLWEQRFSEPDLASKLGLARVYHVNLSDRSPGGGVRFARVSGNDGSRDVTVTLSGPEFRRRLGLRSTFVNVHQWGEFILLMNPADQAANATLTLMYRDRAPSTHAVNVPARSRRTVSINALSGAGDVSVKVDSDRPVAAERAMYFYVHGVDGGHDASGSREPSHTWYFAEGATHSGYSEFLLVNNPSPDRNAVVTVTLHTPTGRTITPVTGVTVGPGRRMTVSVNRVAPGEDVAARVTSEGAAVVAERSMYFRVHDSRGYPLVDGGTASAGLTAAAERWLLAEGATHSGFSTFVLAFNPHSQPVRVAVDLLSKGGVARTVERDVPPLSRTTFSLNALLPGQDVSTVVRSLTPGRGVIAERAMYFRNGLLDGGTGAAAAPVPSDHWYLAEGATHSGFSTFVLVMNPNGEPVRVALDLLSKGGTLRTVERDIPANARSTFSLNPLAAGQDVSTVVRSLTPGRGIVAERAMYFGGRGIDGGHASLGVPALSQTWYFAEGYTG